MMKYDLESAKERYLNGKGDASVCESDAGETDGEWSYILALCELKYCFGHGALDSFLSGPDLHRRITMVEAEAMTNEWLRSELRDTLGLNQSNEWSEDQHQRLSRVATKT